MPDHLYLTFSPDTPGNTDRPLTVTTTHYRGGTAVNTLVIGRRYDGHDRQSEMTVTLNGSAVTSTADTYRANGRLEKTMFGSPRTRSVAYTHTTRGDIASITASDFVQKLTYSADSCRNGSIRVSSWKGSDGIERSYRFSYDGMNRLTRSAYSESGRKTDPLGLVKVEGTASYTESVAYDLWSNPVRIRRHGITEVPASTSRGTLRFGLCDDITLTYSGDRLVRADDAAADCRFSGAMDFTDGASKSAEYTYDAAGNMLTDANKGIDAVTYNRLHRPESVQTGGDTFGFVYDAAGNLLQRTHYHPMGTLNPLGGLMQLTSGLDPGAPTLQSMTDTVSYCGPFEYSGGSLSRVNFPGGYVSGGVAYHYIHDHQGNVRQVVDATTGKVVQENHYYPGGMLFGESTATYFKPGSANNSYRYGGKELLSADGLNLSLHGARMYEPALLRFITPDPLRHKTPHLSSYLYCAANPVMLTDPTGKKITQKIDGITYYYRKLEDQWGFYDGLGTPYTGDGSVAGDLDKIRKADPILDRMITSIADNEKEVRIMLTNGVNNVGQLYNGDGEIEAYEIEYNPECTTGGRALDSNGNFTDLRSPEAGLAHELGHIFEWFYSLVSNMNLQHLNLLSHEKEVCHNEVVSCIIENIYRETNGDPIRVSYYKSSDPQSAYSMNTNLNFSKFDKTIMDFFSFTIYINH